MRKIIHIDMDYFYAAVEDWVSLEACESYSFLFFQDHILCITESLLTR